VPNSSTMRTAPSRRPIAALLLVLALALGLPAGADPLDGDNPWLERRVLNIAHRGGADELPENTLYAFAEGLARGVDMLETDIYPTSDGELVVIHDATVDRTTDGSGAVSDMTLAEVQALDAAHWAVPGRGVPKDAAEDAYVFRGLATGERPMPEALAEAGYTPADFRIPTLAEVLERFPDVPLNIELKTGPPAGDSMAEALADLLAEHGRTDDVVVASFQDQVLYEFKLLAPDVHTAPALAETAALKGASMAALPGVTGPLHHVYQVPVGQFGVTVVDEDFVADAHANGMAVHVWTIDDEAEMRRLIALGVDGIMTDRPSLLEAVIQDMGVAYEPAS
jgi:glycerophosphoryl diester phosphodiesterase